MGVRRMDVFCVTTTQNCSRWSSTFLYETCTQEFSCLMILRSYELLFQINTDQIQVLISRNCQFSTFQIKEPSHEVLGGVIEHYFMSAKLRLVIELKKIERLTVLYSCSIARTANYDVVSRTFASASIIKQLLLSIFHLIQ